MKPERTVLVTGCSDGSLGSALALAFHAAGWRVFASARNVSKMAVMKENGIEQVELDVQSNESISRAVKTIQTQTRGSLDALVNNAGLGYSMPIMDTDMGALRQLFELNAYSIVTISRAFLPLLLASKQKKALIANNTSGMGMLGCGMPFQGGYSASKAAAASLTESLRMELAPFGVQVVNIVTGRVKSTFFQNSNDAVLPEESIYALAREAIEGPMNGRTSISDRENAEEWAKRVVQDLTSANPPHLIYRGGQAGTGKLASIFPLGTWDWLFKKWSGIDVLEQELEKRKGQGKS
ncbi:estradiol 17 beta-dehydrogenase [Fusarium denticulatum]|uniref:Estradiol 17 beta-dehydrogenase n=1 Tax=Fusarium denticulatum TaxID=48507 RepID=A0A8H5UN70_9HYPO|nr:estradiol 17 beta-dehydrogenase [Fusarium denticulatum]